MTQYKPDRDAALVFTPRQTYRPFRGYRGKRILALFAAEIGPIVRMLEKQVRVRRAYWVDTDIIKISGFIALKIQVQGAL